MELRKISRAAIPRALEKALRYRLLNEPQEAESICRDVLAVEPHDQSALVTLLLSLTDQFYMEFAAALDKAKAVLAQIEGDYERAYYEGIIHERWADAQLAKNLPQEFALGWYREAMRCYETAESLSRPDDPDAVLRWNTCARVLQRFNQTDTPATRLAHDVEGEYGDDVPLR